MQINCATISLQHFLTFSGIVISRLNGEIGEHNLVTKDQKLLTHDNVPRLKQCTYLLEYPQIHVYYGNI